MVLEANRSRMWDMWPSFVPCLWEAFAYRARVMVRPRLAHGWGPCVFWKLKHREGPIQNSAGWFPAAAFYFSKEAKKGTESERKRLVN